MVEWTYISPIGLASMPRVINPPRRRLRPEPAPNRKRFTRAECEFLVDNNLLVGRYELIDGEIISKMGQKPPHAIAVTLITDWAVRLFGGRMVRCQLPIDVAGPDRDTNEPEPDVVALVKPATEFMDGHPGPGDICLIVEVADTSLRFDLQTKAALYARTGVPEYWVVDIIGRRIIIHRKPESEGYLQVTESLSDEMISALSRPESPLQVSDLLPPA